MPKRFIVYSREATINQEDSTEPLFWSNEIGWVDLTSATIFTEEDVKVYNLLPDDGIYIQLP